ncbi:putative rhodanese-related sulfurtransferase [Hartmannibacter diazotrophicus]|uniref:tRNA uridine(34) hydroxylase n=1 Tax=Hartmannibacter diazotrophicus TaxID=1482074 RepID=A0A2C9DC49_9HYPH|nr:rhodanese-related sulfurtransferase [Hartmannibacter diazotrophicus]SON57708.1 putative rhodanese-related sulfurtransferase [Hartmannibacter diazotrophicus]
MAVKVAALYQFVSLPDCEDLRSHLDAFCRDRGILGTLLLAEEGINGTVAGSDADVEALIAELRHGAAFKGRLDRLELKFSQAETMPFGKLKVRVKPEIVTMRAERADPLSQVGTYVEPADWNAVISSDDVVVIDVRNHFEVEHGSFRGAVDPMTGSFSEFPAYVTATLDPSRHRKIAMFCTGGIRCEKASAYMLAEGFEEVYHLKGGILAYLEQVPESQSQWEGGCFVFDERVALDHGHFAGEEPSGAEATTQGRIAQAGAKN